ncbi:hemagglutinin domain-containing protein [Campylobacter lari]|uniref:hypothetical protein n=1 Tax=Campylobacter lari TaxID=201 RepID=UPI00397D1863
MKKLANHIILSGVTVSMLFSPLMALPSGGKFTHGTSGKIETSGNTMNITGTTKGGNHVIQWGGGFNIGAGERVNFKGNGQNYLNIAHGAGKSTIKNILDAGGNNVFLINPNGVIIEKSGSIINANRFVASTSSMSNDDMWKFAKSTQEQAASFSPVFKPQKAGNVVNMGNISANDVLLIGNKVLMQGYYNVKDKTFNQVIASDKDKKANIHLVGNEVHADIATFKDIGKLAITAKDEGSLYLNATGYYYNPTSFKNFNYERKSYNNAQDQHGKPIVVHHNENNFINVKYVGIGSDVDWWHFAKGWNENKEGFRSTASEYRLTNDIDFKGNQGKGKEGKDWQNYANYCIDGYGCTNMIVGYNNSFTKAFDGQGHTLKNIGIDTTVLDNEIYNIGIFGSVNDATFKNIKIDYTNDGFIKTNIKKDRFAPIYIGGFVGNVFSDKISSFENISINNIVNISGSNDSQDSHIGGFAGYIGNGYFSQISLKNIKNFNSDSRIHSYTGGFAGKIDNGNFSNISLNEIGNFHNSGDISNYIGGFVGFITDGTFKNIDLSTIEDFSNQHIGNYYANGSVIGGFAGYIGNGKFSNISLNEIGNFYNIRNNVVGTPYSHIGGFAGYIKYGNFSNISLNTVSSFNGIGVDSYVGGFVGYTVNGNFSNISLNTVKDVVSNEKSGGFAGEIENGEFKYITLNNIHNIKSIKGDETGSYGKSGGFAGEIKNGNFSNIVLNNINNIISEGGLKYAYAGGFAGYIGGSDLKTFENIFLYFNPDAKVLANGKHSSYDGKFLGDSTSYRTFSLENILIYYKNGTLNNAGSDFIFHDYIKFYTYKDETQGYSDFEKAVIDNLAKEGLHKDKNGNLIFTTDFEIEKPDITLPTDPTDPTDPSNSDVILDSDDLYADVIMKWIIDEIRNEKYTIDIKNLVSLINAFKGLDKDASETEIKAVVKTHLGIDDDKALSMAQSISFLLNYQEHNFDKRLSDEALAVYNNTIKPSVNNTLGLISYLDKNQAYLLEQYDKYKELKQVFKDKEQDYFKAQAEFNRLLDLVNKGELKYNDPKFTQAFDSWLNAYNAYNALSNDISELNNNVASISNGVKDLGYTNFSFAKFDDITNIDIKEPEIPNIDNSQGGDLPDFEQTASLNLIGDNALNEEEEQEEVDETSLLQKSKTCIVSDNYKTMNPCVVGGL